MCTNIYTYTGRNIDTMDRQTIQKHPPRTWPRGGLLLSSLFIVSLRILVPGSLTCFLSLSHLPHACPPPNRAGTAFVPPFYNHDRLSPILELLDNLKYLFFQNGRKYLCHDFLKQNFHSLYHQQISVNSKTYHVIEHLLCYRQAP